MREQAADLLFRVEFPRDPVFRVVHRHRDTGTAAESIQRVVESVHGIKPRPFFLYYSGHSVTAPVTAS